MHIRNLLACSNFVELAASCIDKMLCVLLDLQLDAASIKQTRCGDGRVGSCLREAAHLLQSGYETLTWFYSVGLCSYVFLHGKLFCERTARYGHHTPDTRIRTFVVPGWLHVYISERQCPSPSSPHPSSTSTINSSAELQNGTPNGVRIRARCCTVGLRRISKTTLPASTNGGRNVREHSETMPATPSMYSGDKVSWCLAYRAPVCALPVGFHCYMSSLSSWGHAISSSVATRFKATHVRVSPPATMSDTWSVHAAASGVTHLKGREDLKHWCRSATNPAKVAV